MFGLAQVVRVTMHPFFFFRYAKIRNLRKSGRVEKENLPEKYIKEFSAVFGVQAYIPHNQAICRDFSRCTLLYTPVHCTRLYTFRTPLVHVVITDKPR